MHSAYGFPNTMLTSWHRRHQRQRLYRLQERTSKRRRQLASSPCPLDHRSRSRSHRSRSHSSTFAPSRDARWRTPQLPPTVILMKGEAMVGCISVLCGRCSVNSGSLSGMSSRAKTLVHLVTETFLCIFYSSSVLWGYHSVRLLVFERSPVCFPASLRPLQIRYQTRFEGSHPTSPFLSPDNRGIVPGSHGTSVEKHLPRTITGCTKRRQGLQYPFHVPLLFLCFLFAGGLLFDVCFFVRRCILCESLIAVFFL